MIRRIRRQFEEVRNKKHHRFDDLEPLIRRCIKTYEALFPRHVVNKKGSKVVFHFGISELHDISLEKEHGNREFIPRKFAQYAIEAIEELLTYIESRTSAAEGPEGESDEGESTNQERADERKDRTEES
jgi:hypothetical protein